MARAAKNKASKTDSAGKGESLDFAENSPQGGQVNESGVPFEEAILKLETIVRELEAGELTLENSLDKFAEGISLSKMCLHKLNSAQVKIDKILQEEAGELILTPLKMQEGGVE